MSDIILFRPRAELDAVANLEGFVSSFRLQLTVFGADLDFESDQWDVSESAPRKGLTHRLRITFSNLESVKDKRPTMMMEPFKSFAKAYIRYMQGLRPVSSLQIRLGALRALEAALRSLTGGTSVELIDLHCLNFAAQLIKSHWSEAAAYRVAGQLELIAETLSESRLIKAPAKWVNSLRRPCDTERIGKDADQRRQARLPSAAALEAVATAFHIASEPADVVISAVATLLCSAPDRINEVLTLPVNCEVHTEYNGKPAYGLRWRPSKGAEPMIKWVLPAMQGVVQEAINRLRQQTERARGVAAWYSANPARFWLPDALEHLRGARLSLPQVASCLCLERRGKALQWLKENGVPLEREGRSIFVHFRDLERAAVMLLPAGFPVLDLQTGLRFEDALFVVSRNFFHSNKQTLPWMIEPVVQQHISDGLGGRSEHGSGSMFDRLGLRDGDGSPISIKTHAFRHYLNTLAQQGGLSQLDIAKWSGRKDVRQNSSYDHVTARALLSRVQEAVGGEDEFFGALIPAQPNAPTRRAEFARLAIKTAHTTDFGYCIHDFAMAPCQLHADCVNCTEHICVKGDTAKTTAIRQRLEEGRVLLARAGGAVEKRVRGANRWQDHHRATVERLEKLLEILEDQTIPNGALVHLETGAKASRVAQAAAMRQIENGEAPFPSLGEQ